MGKRRRPSRKPNYQALEDIKVDNMRMAGDDLALLMEPRVERPLGPAYERLLEITEGFNKRDQKLIDAGVPSSEFQGMRQLQVPALSNGVPAPYIDTVTKPGLERRVHTGVIQNPLTGGREIAAFPHPERPGQALVTEFGDGKSGNIDGLNVPGVPRTYQERREVGDRASEYLGKRIAWLQGDRGAKLINSTDFSVPDMQMSDGRGVDVHTLRTGAHNGVVEIQVNTGVNPTGSIRPGMRQEEAIKQMIISKMRDGYSLPQALTALKQARGSGLTPITYQGRDASTGKLYKDNYDGLISPLFDRNEALLNVYDFIGKGNKRLPSRMQDKTVIKPEKIYSVDLKQLRQPIENMSPREVERSIRLSSNRGNAGGGMQRTRINMNVPVTTPGVTDISQEGYVAQLLKQLTYA